MQCENPVVTAQRPGVTPRDPLTAVPPSLPPQAQFSQVRSTRYEAGQVPLMMRIVSRAAVVRAHYTHVGKV